MAFSFGSPAPAPNGGGLFGSNTPAPAFGTPAAAAPAPFGAAAPSAFGAAPAPFGSPAPAPFGSSAPAPAFGSLAPAPAFGAPAPSAFGAPAPSAFGAPAPLFGSAAPAPSIFGNPATTFGAPAPGGFGSAPAAAQAAPPAPSISGSMRYQDLPPQYKQIIDQIHAAMAQHKKTIHGLQNVSPRIPSVGTMKKIENLDPFPLHQVATDALAKAEEEAVRSVMFAKWPLEAIQAQRGEEKKADDSVSSRLRAALQHSLATRMDRINRMPLPVLWDLIHEAEERLRELEATARKLEVEHEQTKSLLEGKSSLRSVIENQYWKVEDYKKHRIPRLQQVVDELRFHYKQYETEVPNVLEKAQIERAEALQKQHIKLQKSFLEASTSAGGTATGAPATGGTQPSLFLGGSTTPAPAPLFGGTPAPSTGLFGGTQSTTPAPAFGSAPGPAAAFGSTPAPATAFGSTPAPATAFGSTPAPATAFGSTPAPALGSTPAPAPPPAFGATPGPAPTTAAPAFGSTSTFGAPAPAGSSAWGTSKPSKSGRRGKK